MTSSGRGQRGDGTEFYSWAQMAFVRGLPPGQEGMGLPDSPLRVPGPRGCRPPARMISCMEMQIEEDLKISTA